MGTPTLQVLFVVLGLSMSSDEVLHQMRTMQHVHDRPRALSDETTK